MKTIVLTYLVGIATGVIVGLIGGYRLGVTSVCESGVMVSDTCVVIDIRNLEEYRLERMLQALKDMNSAGEMK